MRTDLGTKFNCDICNSEFIAASSDAIKPLGWTRLKIYSEANVGDCERFLSCDKCWTTVACEPEAKKTILLKFKERLGIS